MTKHHTTTGYRFAPVPEDLLYDPTIDHLAVRVYAVLMRHGLTPDSCYPTHRRIAELVGVAARSIQRPLRRLEEAGWVERVPRFDDRGDRISDGFVVHTAAQHSEDTAHLSVEAPRSPARPHRAPERGLKENHENENQGTILDVDPAPSSAPTVDPFDEFWEVYPRRVAKGSARTAFARAAKQAGADVVVEGARRFAADPNLPEERFVPHPATWLRSERWVDGPLPARGPAPRRAKVETDRDAPAGRVEM